VAAGLHGDVVGLGVHYQGRPRRVARSRGAGPPVTGFRGAAGRPGPGQPCHLSDLVVVVGNAYPGDRHARCQASLINDQMREFRDGRPRAASTQAGIRKTPLKKPRPKVIGDDMLIFARALKDNGTPVPEIAKNLVIRTGKNAGKHPWVASLTGCCPKLRRLR